MPAAGLPLVYAAADCEVDLAKRELRVSGAPVPVGGRAFDVIKLLVEAGGELVTKDALMKGVWPGAIVSDNALQVHILALRKALGAHRAMLRTESGRGYRLLGGWTGRPPVSERPATFPITLTGRAEGSSATNLPVAVTSLIGRSAAARYLRDLVTAYRLVTLTGPGGIGKTVLALQVGRDLSSEFPDGSWFVELAPLSDPALVPSTVASVLGLTLDGATISSATIAGAIGRQHMLLILDNCEHVIGAVAELVETIVRLCPNATLFTTSREIIRADGEYVYRVRPLDVPSGEASRDILDHSAVELFVARAKALDYSPSADALPLVAGICRRLDGIPLAIEFAAARTATLGIEHVTSGLNDRFALLSRGRRTALPRHRTLRATLDWSYDLLAEEERLLFCRLAIFPAGFTLGDAVAVSGDKFDESDVINGIASLVEKSLVAVDAFQAGSRWRLLETIRSYAHNKLAERGDADEAARRHAAYFRDLLASAAPDFRSRLPTQNLIRYRREIDNVRAALDWSFSASGDVTIGLDLTAAYVPVWMNFSLLPECRARCEEGLRSFDATTNVNARLRMVLQIGLGISLMHTSGPSAEAQAMLVRALETAETLGDLGAQARALLPLSGVCRFRAEYGKAAAVTERLRQIAQQIGDPSIAAVADRLMGNSLITNGRLSEAQRCFERVIQSVHVEGQRMLIWRRRSADHAMARAMLARAFWLQGFAERAKNEVQASLDALQGADHQLTVCQVLYFSICRIAPMTGDFGAAERAIAQLTDAAMSLNSRFWMTIAQFVEGKLMVERRQFAEGTVVLRTAFATCQETGWRPSYPEFRGSLALALGGLGQLHEATDVVSDAIASAGGREDGQRWYLPELLRIKAEILLRQPADQSSLAENWLDQAATMAGEQGALTWELRIALSRAHLRAAHGRRDEARRLLASVYDRFTEGFETTDLRAARAMLEKISL
jgi:predicted ATPase/DNA-binding winged helix-turn-helix (wHTH) protein